MEDGLYQVTTKFWCAGFVIKNGRLSDCAPVFQKNSYWNVWKVLAKRVGDDPLEDDSEATRH
jgi:hypothetical protein